MAAKPMMKLAGLLFLYFLGGCDRWFEEQKIQELNQSIVESKTVFDKWLIGEVSAGEIVHFEIKAIEEGEQFSEVYTKTVKSFWESRKCTKKTGSGKIYCGSWKSNAGVCEVFYRDSIGLSERFIDLSKWRAWPFKITVGGIRYPLDSDFTTGPTALKGKLTIAEKMMAHGDDLAIEVIQEEPREIYEGFLGFGECEGKDKHKFTVDASMSYLIVEWETLRKLKVTVRR